MIHLLNSTAFNVFGAPTTWAEVLGFLTGGLAVYYAARNRLATWPWSIANAVFFFVLFINARLYADAWLQVFYLVLSVAGLVWWKFGKWIVVAWQRRSTVATAYCKPEAPIRRTGLLHLWAVACAVAIFVISFTPHLRHVGDPYPFLDALTTGMSLGAQYLLSLRYFENWFIWIAVDLIYIPLYQAKGLTLTAIIYVVFLALCFLGVRDWWRQYRAQRQPVVAVFDRATFDDLVRDEA